MIFELLLAFDLECSLFEMVFLRLFLQQSRANGILQTLILERRNTTNHSLQDFIQVSIKQHFSVLQLCAQPAIARKLKLYLILTSIFCCSPRLRLRCHSFSFQVPSFNCYSGNGKLRITAPENPISTWNFVLNGESQAAVTR